MDWQNLLIIHMFLLSPQLKVDELAKLFVYDKEPPNIAYKNNIDKNPSKYRE